MKTPDFNTLNFAAAWLDEYDSDAAGRDQLVEVGTWLREQSNLALDRHLAKKNNVSLDRFRTMLKKNAKANDVDVVVLRQAFLEKIGGQ